MLLCCKCFEVRTCVMFKLLFLFLFTIHNTADGFPSGAPRDFVCHKKFPIWPRDSPIHYKRVGPNWLIFKAKPNPIINPYVISVDTKKFNTHTPVRFNITGPPFKGFLVYAIDPGAEITVKLGQFWPIEGNTDTKTLSCVSPNDTATHTNSKFKTIASFEWYAPMYTRMDGVAFKATVVQNLDTFYMDITSATILPVPTAPVDQAAAGAGGGNDGEGPFDTPFPYSNYYQGPYNYYNYW